MTEGSYKFVATTENFVATVVEGSTERPVLVDFWAPWCGPCRTLMPLLDRIADEYGGRFALAKVNTDEEQQIAAHFGIRSIPTVMLFHHGKVVEQFVGAQPEQSVRALLDRHVAPVATDDPDSPATLVARVEALLAARDASGAAAVLNQLAARDPEHKLLKPLRARTAFVEAAAARPDFAALRAVLERDPGDAAARHALAAHHALAGDYATALAEWLELMRRDRRFGDDLARRSLLATFDILGEADELAKAYRRKLASLLH